ncbi:hydroxymethylglutaryl-CoA synthase [Aerococcus sp. 1KP-2016]|uniref:hydroxymethylglutaryl-CoA synthase n=1 Tax=Aerococcus sp. 1KP-2016 TaxID=1981982 RepID=UPI000B992695|nr:hydroxymethylglutaryl-CoA synthase [Aerococcus sp. 1KP-2016]OYQ66066.1 hydroxymethylglutaryl-CoA synthase [Aerococcus sp. 1KP-2016]
MNIGIDKFNFFTPHVYLDMEELAEARDVDPAKFTIGLGQMQQAVAPLTQDPVSMAANAAWPMLTDEDKAAIDFVIVASESGIDQSKAMAVYVHQLLGINPYARSIEMKEACYGATVGIQTAVNHIARHPESKVLVIATDIARYGLQTSGESTQGAGAVAMLISKDPHIAVINDDAVSYTGDIHDFWRPNYSPYPEVNGHFSNQQYLQFLDNVWTSYKERFNHTLEDFKAFAFHLPYSKMGLKGLRQMLPEVDEIKQNDLIEEFEASRVYNKRVGNIYTGSLYLSLISLIEQSTSLQAGDLIGVFSYGSGAVAEFYSITLVDGFEDHLAVKRHQEMLDNRIKLSVTDYELIFQEALPTDGSQLLLPEDEEQFQLAGIEHHHRIYR